MNPWYYVNACLVWALADYLSWPVIQSGSSLRNGSDHTQLCNLVHKIQSPHTLYNNNLKLKMTVCYFKKVKKICIHVNVKNKIKRWSKICTDQLCCAAVPGESCQQRQTLGWCIEGGIHSWNGRCIPFIYSLILEKSRSCTHSVLIASPSPLPIP